MGSRRRKGRKGGEGANAEGAEERVEAQRPGQRDNRDVVTVRDVPSAIHTRLPGYLRGRSGIVEEAYPRPVLYTDSVPTDSVSTPQPVYRVKFKTRDLWPDIPDSDDVLYNDCFETYLEKAA